MKPETLARVVDDRILELPPSRKPARLFAVHLCDDGEVVLALLWSGYARELPMRLVPPVGAYAIALDTMGWSGPMDEGRPSRHPLRRRIHHTGVIFGDAEDVSIVRSEDAEPQVLRGAIGFVHDLLVACWLRRPASA